MAYKHGTYGELTAGIVTKDVIIEQIGIDIQWSICDIPPSNDGEGRGEYLAVSGMSSNPEVYTTMMQRVDAAHSYD